MKKNLCLAAVYYQQPTEPPYLPNLERWVAQVGKLIDHPYVKSIMIASDLETPIAEGNVPQTVRDAFLPYMQFPVTGNYAGVMRAGIPMDRKEAIVLALVRKMGEMNMPLLVVDLDTVLRVNVMRHFEHALNEGRGRYWGMCEDYGKRSVLDTDGSRCPEHNAGVMWFGEPFKNEEIVNNYFESFRDLKRLYHDNSILGQKAWSRAHANLGGTILPREYNWSHRWGENPNAYITHYHGPVGKAKMPVNGS